MSKKILGQEDNLKLLDLAADNNLSALLIGDTGSGKTSMIQAKAEEKKMKSIRFNLTGETTVDEFVGKYVLIGGETVWQDGILLKAMKEGLWLIVDEINVALPEILFVLHSLLDDDKQVIVAQHETEIVKPHKNFRFFATMNPTDEYSGTKELNKAFKSRFQLILQVDYPDNMTEIAIIKLHVPDVQEKWLSPIISVANHLRAAKKCEEIFYTCSTRDLIQWAKLATLTGDIEIGFRNTIHNKGNGDGEKIKTIFESVIAKYKSLKAAGIEVSPEYYESKWQELEAAKKNFEQEKKTLKEKVAKELVASVLK